jgi:hypothetical protein
VIRATPGNDAKLGKQDASRIAHVRMIEYSDPGKSPQIHPSEVFDEILPEWLAQNLTSSLSWPSLR